MIRGTREWAVAEIDCCIGCTHGCRYCYGRANALRNGKIQALSEWDESVVVTGEVEKCQPLYPGQVMFPANHDITEQTIEAALTVIGNLLDSGNRVLIVSKPSPPCIVRLCDAFADKRQQILFRFTITARDPDILTFWEPGAPTYRERRQALELAAGRGFATSVSIEPMLDAADVITMVQELEGAVSHSIWVGKMNRIDERVASESEQAREEMRRIRQEQGDVRILELYGKLKDHPLLRWKESIKEVVGLPLMQEPGLDR